MFNWFKRRNNRTSSYETNEEWVKALSQPVDERAVALLRRKLIQGLKPALHKYVDRELDQFVEDVAQDALLKILDNIDSFRGESKLLTWAMKIAVREGLTELRLKRYDDSSLEEFKHPGGSGRDELTSLTFASDMPDPVATAVNGILDHIHAMDQRLEDMCRGLKELGAEIGDVSPIVP